MRPVRQQTRWVRHLVLVLMVLAPFIGPVGSATAQAQSDRTGTTVAIEGGRIDGAVADGVLSFKGVPYAAPPVSELRWRAPQPVVPWSGVRPATAFGPDCAQAPSDFEPIQTVPAEDCLFVNVWRPVASPPDARLPVLVWVHGGGFVGGGSSIPWYDGSAFARQGLVVVSLNYRLGRLGYFAHPALLQAGEGPVGNFGSMDQLAALQWVQRNIGAFGGDPAQVTLMGQSAGGASVLTLLTSPVGAGLFQRAVVLSGGGRDGLVLRQMIGGTADRPSADQIDAGFARSLGIEGEGSAALHALRALPAAAVQGDLTLVTLAVEALVGAQVYQGTPMIDGVIVVGQPGEVLAAGLARRVPLLIGTTAEDLPLFLPPRSNPLSFFGPDAEQAVVAYEVPATLDSDSLTRVILAVSQDMTMHEPARFAARQMTAHGAPAWLYRFTYTAEALRPAVIAQSHAGELPFLFNTLARRYGPAVTPTDQQVATVLNAAVATFARTGDPNGAGRPAWPAFDPNAVNLLHFSLDNGPVYERDPLASRVQLVEQAYERQTQADRRCFAETTQCIAGRLRAFWERNGGLPVFGLPLGPPLYTQIEGRPVQVQWFERHRLELHPTNPSPHDVLLGRLGAERLAQQGRDWQTFPAAEPATRIATDCRFFAQTNHAVCGEFWQAYQQAGLELGDPGVSEQESRALFGLPLSEPMLEAVEGTTYQVQWFERARFERHPDRPATMRILFGRLGAEMLAPRP